MVYTTREAGDFYGVGEWRVRRLFESGILPEPPRFGYKRVIDAALLSDIGDKLREHGWLPESEACV